MITYKIIKIGNYGVIRPIPGDKLAAMLLKHLSYERQGAEFMPNPAWAIVKLYNVKKGTFAWGLLDSVQRVFQAWCGYSQDIVSYESRNNSLLPTYPVSLRPYQIEAVNTLRERGNGIICMPTGSGKTITILEYLISMTYDRNVSSVIVTPTLDIKKMWEEKILECGLKNARVINHQSPLAKEMVEHSDIIVFDECHHVSAKTIYSLAMYSSTDSIVIGCSATPEREDGEDMRMFGAIGPILYRIDRRKLIDDGYLSDAEVQYLRPAFNTNGDFVLTYSDLYNKHIVNNSSRNDLIIACANEYVSIGKKVMILVSHIEHGQTIFDMLSIDQKIFCHGATDDRYSDLTQFDCIVASNIFNEGINLPELDVVILAAGGKSSIQLTQRVGRVLRLKSHGRKAIIIDFIDTPKFLSKHYKRRRALLERDFPVVEL